MLYKTIRGTRIIQLSQRNGKLPLPQQKQGNYPVITIYAGTEPDDEHDYREDDDMDKDDDHGKF